MENTIQTLKLLINGQKVGSTCEEYMPIFNPSTGDQIAKAPCCTVAEVETAIAAAKSAFPIWRNTPAHKRAKLFFRLRELVLEHLSELSLLLATENGKNITEAEGDVLKAVEMIEIACGIPTQLMGESLMDTSSGYDTTLYRESLGVFVGLAPFNFPAMIPMGWMAPLAIACGNTYIVKAANATPMTALRFSELYKEAGFPDGVINVVTCNNEEAEIFLSHPDVKGITFVGSTNTGKYIYSTAAKYGKRVQALCEAKNHALVLKDAPIGRSVAGIINASFGCAGERCMALPVVVVENAIADQFIEELLSQLKTKKVGPAYDSTTDLGPVVTKAHKDKILGRIAEGIEEGAELILDGRDVLVEGCENGYYIGHTVFDHVKPGMSIGEKEIFGPVLCIKRVDGFEEGLALMNENPYANGSVIFTQSGYYAREFAKRTDGGMVGVNVGIPVPVGIFPFCGHKNSFFGDLHAHGKDFIRFFTESKTVTTRWFDDVEKNTLEVNTWDGSMVR